MKKSVRRRILATFLLGFIAFVIITNINQSAILTVTQASMLSGQYSDTAFQQSMLLNPSNEIDLILAIYGMCLLLLWGQILYDYAVSLYKKNQRKVTD